MLNCYKHRRTNPMETSGPMRWGLLRSYKQMIVITLPFMEWNCHIVFLRLDCHNLEEETPFQEVSLGEDDSLKEVKPFHSLIHFFIQPHSLFQFHSLHHNPCRTISKLEYFSFHNHSQILHTLAFLASPNYTLA